MSRLRQRVDRRIKAHPASPKGAALSRTLGAVGCLCFGLLYGWIAGTPTLPMPERIGAGLLAVSYLLACYGWRARGGYAFILTAILVAIEVLLNLYLFATTGHFAAGWVHLILLLVLSRALLRAGN
ncbi:MAG: hypothetical protein Q7P63_10015 [Verrucomicrobiota bacterium JB022]|nr:hypothetical protein [Verrucomicrobiota bacterium JB022]